MHRLSVLDGNVHYYVYYYVKLKVKSWTTVSLSTCKTLMESVIVVGSETWTFPSHVTRTRVRYTLLRRGEERPLNPIFLISADGIRSTEAGELGTLVWTS